MFNEFKYSTREPQLSDIREHVVASPSFGHHSYLLLGRNLLQEVNGMAAFKDSDIPEKGPPKKHSSLLYLAPREKEVLLWAARGKSAWETAELLDLSEKTIKFYIRNACSRLKAQNKTHAVALCVSEGLFRI